MAMRATLRRLRRRLPRGFSLIEALMAGAILTIGLMGVVLMLIRSTGNTRDGTTAINASVIAGQTMQELSALGFDGLVATAMTDGGLVRDDLGREYRREVTITSVANTGDGGYVAGDGGAYLVNVAVLWRDSIGRGHRNVVSTVVSRTPDAGP